MRRASWVIVIALLAAASADAQRGMGGMGGMGGGGMGGRRGGGMGGGSRQPEIKFPAAKSLEKHNPATLVLDKRKKLALSDSQATAFKAIQMRIFERNGSLLVRYDSLQRDFRMPKMDMRDEAANDSSAQNARRASMMQMRQLLVLVDSLQDRRRADVREVLEALPDDAQRKKAASFLDEQDVEFNNEFPQARAQGGARGGERGDERGGRGGRGGRP